MTPAIALAVLLVLIGAQAARVAAPRRGSYPWLLLLGAAGLGGAELVCFALRIGGPSLGALHPVADVLGIAALELGGLLFAPARRIAP